MSDTKAIIELDQEGDVVRVFLAEMGAGQPLVERKNPSPHPSAPLGPIPDLGPGHTPRKTIVFYEGNCIWIGGKKYCT